MSLTIGKSYFKTASNGVTILCRGPLDTSEEIKAGYYANACLGHYDHAIDPAVAKQEQMQANLACMDNNIATFDWAWKDATNQKERW